MLAVERLVVNSDLYLECAGRCAGCFLTADERKETNLYKDAFLGAIEKIATQYQGVVIENLVIGLGRGNYLLLDDDQVDTIVDLLAYIKSLFTYKSIVFEVSTSLIGKIDQQIKVAKKIVSQESNVFFNVVINSELTSLTYWLNVERFYKELQSFRFKKTGVLDGTGDILTLSINPDNLPYTVFNNSFLKELKSPLNISLFPYLKKEVNDDDLESLSEWVKLFKATFRESDVNVFNFIDSIRADTYTVNDVITEKSQTHNVYYFITKEGDVVTGLMSIMGEVDSIRAFQKYHVDFSFQSGFRSLNRNRKCVGCEYQKECIMSGAYLNMIVNSKSYVGDTHSFCLSGYYEFF